LIFNEAFIEQTNRNSLYQTIGIRIEEASDGQARSVLIPKAEVCWPYPGQPHGGILFALMDTTMGWAVNTTLEPGYSCTTINANIQYLAPAQKGPFRCLARVTRQTGRLAFVQADVSDAQGHLLAAGQAVFRIIKMDLPESHLTLKRKGEE
jgi:uncharacterized protein (TIGR00369 family)